MQHEREARSNKLTLMIGPGTWRVVTEVEKPRGSTFLLESDWATFELIQAVCIEPSVC